MRIGSAEALPLNEREERSRRLPTQEMTAATFTGRGAILATSGIIARTGFNG